MAKVEERLRENRLATITGAGGCGKTRLALEVGGRIVNEFRDGVWLIDLAPLSDASLVCQPLAAVFGIREEPGRSAADAVTDYLRDRTTLIILDNCERSPKYFKTPICNLVGDTPTGVADYGGVAKLDARNAAGSTRGSRQVMTNNPSLGIIVASR